jgi:3',5'-cyclic-nucleotide phosphodiesterase
MPNTINIFGRSSKFTLILAMFSVFGHAGDGFDVIALGVWGGIKDGNLSAYMIQPHGDNNSVTCDAGTLINGIDVAVEKGSFNNIQLAKNTTYALQGTILRDHIKGYLVSHAHMDHIAGLIIASPDDTKKPIYAFAPILDTIQNSYFNWSAWPNFGNSGKAPLLGQYQYTTIIPNVLTPIIDTTMSVMAFPLSHDGTLSSAFIIENGDDFVVCLGDTGPDQVEHADNLEQLWVAVANKIKTADLKGIIIESSYTNARDDSKLYGHLTPKHLMNELKVLAAKIPDKKVFNGLPVIINHIKYSLKRKGDVPTQMHAELQALNTLGVRLIIPKQGQRWHLQ